MSVSKRLQPLLLRPVFRESPAISDVLEQSAEPLSASALCTAGELVFIPL